MVLGLLEPVSAPQVRPKQFDYEWLAFSIGPNDMGKSLSAEMMCAPGFCQERSSTRTHTHARTTLVCKITLQC